MEHIRAYFAVLLSFILALSLTLMPLPEMFFGMRPNWVTLVLIYWIIFLPDRVGVYMGFTAGIVLDILRGSFLGSMGLTLTLVAEAISRLRGVGVSGEWGKGQKGIGSA